MLYVIILTMIFKNLILCYLQNPVNIIKQNNTMKTIVCLPSSIALGGPKCKIRFKNPVF